MKFLKDIFEDGNGKISMTRLWTNIAYSVGLYKFMILTDASPDIWLIVLGVIGGHAAVSKLLDKKYGTSTGSGVNSDVESTDKPG